MTEDPREQLTRALRERFDEEFEAPSDSSGAEQLARMAARGSCRRFRGAPVAPELIETLCAVALCSPTKSDLQQRDVVILRDAEKRRAFDALIAGHDWLAQAPAMLVFCGNNRRQRQIHDWRRRDFANDHLDAFFNPAVDAGIALSAFVLAAEAVGLGCCPLSVVRNRAVEVSRLLALPDHVFPVAGLAVGWSEAATPRISHRLPTRATVHVDAFSEDGLREAVDRYDARRRAAQPFRNQRMVDRFGEDPAYGWSEDKARQYSAPEREGFGAFVRAKGFKLD